VPAVIGIGLSGYGIRLNRCRKVQLPIGRSVPLTEAIEALTALETNHTPKGGKLIITIE
jgi:hypothetical protein